MRYVIVGNSFAGTFAIEAIRSIDRQGEIVLIGDEPERLYSRAMIHEYLAGVVDESKMFLRDRAFHSRLDVTALSGQRAEKLLPESHEIVVDGEKMVYNKLLLAVGGSPFVPPGIEGLDAFKDCVFGFTRMADAAGLSRRAQEARRVVVLGAGLIGMQAAEAFAHLGKQVTVVELANQVLPLATDDLAAEMLQTEMQEEGVQFRTGNSVTALLGENGVLRAVKLRSGEEIEAELFVIAVGVRPNVGWLRDSGLVIDRGIVVDEHLQTNLEDVYAAGDCAQGLELISGSRMVLATIPVASEQGLTAGYNMAGMEAEYRGGIPLNALQFGRLQMVSYGYMREKDGQEVVSLLDEDKRVYKKIVLEDGRITGTLFVRAIDRAGVFRRLIEDKVDVSAFTSKLLSDEFGAAALPEEIRREMFEKPQSRIAVRRPEPQEA